MRGEAGELDLETGSGGGGEAALPEGSCEVIGGELVFGVAGGAEDADATGQGLVGYGVDFAGHRNELERLGLNGCGDESGKNGEDGTKAEKKHDSR